MRRTNSIYSDVRNILENRRIRSQILQEQKKELILKEHPQLQKIEDQIAEISGQILLNSLDGKNNDDLSAELRKLQRKREDILMDCGISTDDFLAEPYCKKCGDTGYVRVTGKDGTETETFCECMRSLLAPVMISRSGVDRYPGYSFEKGTEDFFSHNPSMKEYYTTIRDLAREEAIPNMYFCGKPQEGKTFIAVSVARQYAVQGRSSLVIRMAEVQEIYMEYRRILQSFYTPSQKEVDIEERVHYLLDVDLLVLDDLGVEPHTKNTETDLLNLLEKRILSGKSTIITSNFDFDQIKQHYMGRVFERIQRSFKRVPFSEPPKEVI